MIRKLPDWQTRFHDLLQIKLEDKFEWGRNDCVLCAADFIMAMTGEDLARPYRGAYGTEDEARDFIATKGGARTFIPSICIRAGMRYVRPQEMQAGDVALFDMITMVDFMGVYDGYKLLVPSICGITSISTTKAKNITAMRIPRCLTAA